MISSFRHLSRSAALHSSRRHCLRPSVSSVAPFFCSFSTTSNDPPAPKDKGHVLTKTDLVQILAAEHDLKMAESNRILDTLLDTIMEAVSKEGAVSISGFGKFTSRAVEAREYRNPATGGKISKDARNVPKFKAFTHFKDCVGGDEECQEMK